MPSTHPRRLAAASIVALCIVATAHAQRHDDLLGMLRSGDPQQRALARQLLPQANVELVRDVLPLLSHENEAVWRTASNVLADFANEVSAPGRIVDREFLAVAMLERLERLPGHDEAARLLNLVHLVLPEGADVAPIAAYLHDESLRINARDALQLAGTSEARAALRIALPAAKGTFALALMDSLRLLRDGNAKEVLIPRLQDSDPAIRAGAARALAWTGDAGLIEPFQRVVRDAPKDRYVESGDALLALADAMAANGGQFDRALELYDWALRELDGPILRGAAIAGLGTYGDERVIPWLLDAARKAGAGTLDHAALEAFAVVQGQSSTNTLFELHDSLLDTFGPSIYGVYGRRANAEFTPVLIEALGSDDAYERHVAVLALLDSDRAEAVRAVAQYAIQLEDEPRALLANVLELKAAAFRRESRADAAGAAYAGLYRLAATDKAREFALDGMMRYPSDDAIEIVKDLVDQDDLAKFPVPFLAGIARALHDANRTDEAARVLDAMLPRLLTSEDIQAYLDVARGSGSAFFADRLGFIRKWSVIGPFPWSTTERFAKTHIDSSKFDASASYSAGNGESRTWTTAQASATDGVLNLVAALGDHANAAAYAYAEFEVAEAGDYVLRLGSDDGIKAWVNGEVVHEHHVDRPLVADQDQAPIQLRAGMNAILLEITQGAGGWAFCARITRPDGSPLVATD